MKRILCIDAQTELDKVKAAAQRAGYEVLTAASAGQALQLLASEPVDGVLLDCYLPGSDTAALEREMLRLKPNLPVLLFCGSSSLADISLRCMDAYIEGPAPPDSLLARAARLPRTNT
jgi:DNA-binding response OmpR family regulator